MAKLVTHCLTESFPVYQNEHLTIRRMADHTVVQSSNRIILKIVGLLVYFLVNSTKNFTIESLDWAEKFKRQILVWLRELEH